MIGKYAPEHIGIILDSAPEGNFNTFVPGQMVSGKVVYSPPYQIDIDRIEIVFKGKCFTLIKEQHSNGTSTYTTKYPEKIVLMRLSEDLFRGPSTLQHGRYEWPFSFRIPDRAIYHRKAQSRDGRFQMGEQSLPPSFKLESESHSHPPEAKVSYELKVKINPGKMRLRSTQLVHEIIVWPISKTPLPAPVPSQCYCTGDGRFKSNKLRPEKHTFKEKLSHVFTSDPSLKTPEINLAASITMPHSVGISQQMPLEISCKYKKIGENDPEQPELTIFDCQVVLKSYVSVRAMGTITDHHKDGKQTVISRTIPGNNSRVPLDGSFI
jgi:hypothetical protein